MMCILYVYKSTVKIKLHLCFINVLNICHRYFVYKMYYIVNRFILK